MEIIDIHTHIFPDNIAPRAIAKMIENAPEAVNHTDGTLSGLKKSMQESGVAFSVTLPVSTKPSQVQDINRIAVSLTNEDSVIPFGTLHPLLDNPGEEISFLRSQGIRGIKLHPEYQNFHIDDKAIYPVYEQLCETGLVVIFHAGKDNWPFSGSHSRPEAIKKVHRLFPKMKMVAAHLGGWKIWDEAERVLCKEEIWFDTSAVTKLISREQFIRICRKHGTERILFGSDSPWFDQKESITWIEQCGLSSSEMELICDKNGSRLLGI